MSSIGSAVRISSGDSNVRLETSLREQVLSELRSEIVAGRAESGAVYSVPSVAHRLGVSTTPVREALLELTRLGLLTPMRNRGFRVVEPTIDDLNDLFDVRETLEVDAAIRVARNHLVDVSALRPIADAIGEAVERGDVDTYLELDREFHRGFAGLSGNRLLTDLIMNLRDNMRLYGIGTQAGIERQRASVREHHELLRLAQERNVDAIAPLMRLHIGSWRDVFSAGIGRRRDVAAKAES